MDGFLRGLVCLAVSSCRFVREVFAMFVWVLVERRNYDGD